MQAIPVQCRSWLKKYITLINHNGFAILHAFSLAGILNYNFPFSSDIHISPIIMHVIYVATTLILELMNLLHRNKFSPWEDFFVIPFGSDVISPNQLCKCTCISTGAG